MTIEQLSDDKSRVIILKAVADPMRLKIVRMLYKHRGEMNCGEIGEQLNIQKSTVSYHFRTLREAGLTTTRKSGPNKYVELRLSTFDTYLPGFLNTL